MFIDPVAFKALQNIVAEVETVIAARGPLGDDDRVRCLELLRTAKALMDDIVKRASSIQ
jgi:hypothetical protein